MSLLKRRPEGEGSLERDAGASEGMRLGMRAADDVEDNEAVADDVEDNAVDVEAADNEEGARIE